MDQRDLKTSGAGFDRRRFLTRTALGAGAVLLSRTTMALGEKYWGPPSANAWSFGVMADTQWTLNGDADDGYDPNSSTAYIAEQIQQKLINLQVSFVIHVGDLCDNGSTLGEQTRALYAQKLYNAGIGFFPLRGNHDDSAANAATFQSVYPQTQDGYQNKTLSALGARSTLAARLGLTAADIANLGFPNSNHGLFAVGDNFSSPTIFNGGLKGLSYSFDFVNARFVLLDQFTPVGGWPAGYNMLNTINAQQAWINAQLAGRASGSHAFVFAHKGLITCNHADVLFGSTPADNPTYTDSFMASLAQNNVKFYIHGHDHMHDHSVVTDTTGSNAVHQLLCASDSSKFYVPTGANSSFPQKGSTPGYSNDQYYNYPAFNLLRRTPISQELNIGLNTPTESNPQRDIGFYIFTVDGDQLTVDYYAVTVPVVVGGGEVLLPATPGGKQSNAFTSRETFGYSLNGKEFLVGSGGDYSVVQDSAPGTSGYTGTTSAAILSGTNSNTIGDANGVLLTKAVNTGWAPQQGSSISDILTIWGMGSLGAATSSGIVSNPAPKQTDVYVLQLETGSSEPLGNIAKGGYGLATMADNGKWVNAIARNQGSANKPKFVSGPWKSSYGLGTYGVNGKTAWAVVNHQGRFAITTL